MCIPEAAGMKQNRKSAKKSIAICDEIKETKMKVLGITGGVGAGKSTVLAYLEKQYGVRVIQADLAAHQLQMPGTTCYKQIAAEFGPEIFRMDGSINREILGKIVYSDKTRLTALNNIVHPEVKAYIIREIEKERQKNQIPFLVVEAALLLEDGYDKICDEIWYIDTKREVREHRLQISRGYSMEKIRSIMANQKTEEDYRCSCNFVVDNSSDFVENTYEQIDKGLREHGFL